MLWTKYQWLCAFDQGFLRRGLVCRHRQLVAVERVAARRLRHSLSVCQGRVIDNGFSSQRRQHVQEDEVAQARHQQVE